MLMGVGRGQGGAKPPAVLNFLIPYFEKKVDFLVLRG